MSKKVWLCSASDLRMPQVRALCASVARHTEYKFGRLDPHPGAPPEHERSLLELIIYRQRLAATLKMLKEGAHEVIISGADYFVYSPLLELHGAEYADYSCLFTPHVLELMPDPPAEQNLNLSRAGVINSDFQVWRNSLKVREFLETVVAELGGPQARLRDAFDFEQAWLPLALSCANGGLIKHPGYAVAYYNFHERTVLSRNGKLVVDTREQQKPLRTFHFSGMDFRPGSHQFTKYAFPFKRTLSAAEANLIADYRRDVCANPS